MTFLAAAAPAIAGAAGGLLGGLFGSKASAPQVQYTPPGFSAGGLNATFGPGGYTVAPDASRTGAVGNIASTFGQQAGAFGDIRQQFAPGFSALRAAQLGQINANRTAAIGNLQQNLQNRRVLGSSFAQDAINRTTAQYDQQQQQVIAQTYLQELAAQEELIQKQYTASVQQYQTGLTEMNLEAGLAADLTSKASSTLADAAKTNAELQAKAQQGAGQFFGGIGSMLGKGIGGLFGGGSAAAGTAAGTAASAAGAGADMSSIGTMASALGAIF